MLIILIFGRRVLAEIRVPSFKLGTPFSYYFDVRIVKTPMFLLKICLFFLPKTRNTSPTSFTFPALISKEMWPLHECVFYVQIKAAKAGLF